MADAVRARLELVNGTFALSDATKAGMTTACTVLSSAAEAIVVDLVARGLLNPASPVQTQVDVGRLIAALDTLQAAKNLFCDALTLPHAPKLLDLAKMGDERSAQLGSAHAVVSAPPQ